MTSAMQDTNRWKPNWATHPGEHLEEYLETRGFTQARFARLAGLSPKLVSEIISGKNPVSSDTALALERVLGVKAHIWTGLQAEWDLFQARQRSHAASPERKLWLKQFPIAELKKRGVLPDTQDECTIWEGILSLFGIGKPESYQEKLNVLAVQHRQSKGPEASEHHIYTWLVLGERKARCMNLPAFSSEKFDAAVKRIRKLSRERPSVFEPVMKAACLDAGVALIFEPPISKTRLFGSARWLDGDKAIIQMSLRMKSNDHFWWTFFHECGHIVLHKGRNFADDHNGCGDGLESEADAWAENILYGKGGVKRILASPPKTEDGVRRLAEEMDLHPGVVVGMLQHYGALHFSQLAHLKEKYDFTE